MNTWRKEMWIAGYKYSWKNMEVAAQHTAGLVTYIPLGAPRHK